MTPTMTPKEAKAAGAYLAIDPGCTESALVWRMADGYFISDKMPNDQMLEYVQQAHGPGRTMAIEMVASYGMPVGKEVFDTCVWIGRFIQAWPGQHRLIYRKDVKMHLCQSLRANDASIRAALIDQFGPGKERAVGNKKSPGPLYGFKGDTWAALAVWVTATETG